MEEFLCGPCVATMPTAKFAMALAMTLIASLLGLFRAHRRFSTARLIEDMPTSRIRSASQGYVELAGLAQIHDHILASPLTGNPCLWWRYTVERYEKSGKSHHWRTIDKGHSRHPFNLDDSSGVCTIDPEGAEVACQHRKVWYGNNRHPAGAGASKSVLTSGGLASLSLGRRYRYTEYLIREGDPIYVLGHFESDSTGQRLLRVDQLAGQIISQWKQNFPALLANYDKDHSGELEMDEWHQVRRDAKAEALTEQRRLSQRENSHLVQQPHSSSLPFLIGSLGQEQLSRRFRWQAAGYAALFLASGSAVTWLLTNRFIL